MGFCINTISLFFIIPHKHLFIKLSRTKSLLAICSCPLWTAWAIQPKTNISLCTLAGTLAKCFRIFAQWNWEAKEHFFTLLNMFQVVFNGRAYCKKFAQIWKSLENDESREILARANSALTFGKIAKVILVQGSLLLEKRCRAFRTSRCC